MAWMMDEYSRLAGVASPAVITGKPLAVGGSPGRGDATARGGVLCIQQAAAHLGMDLREATVAIQGFGNAGAFAASLLTSLVGARIIAVSDSSGGVYSPGGLDPELLQQHKERTGSVAGFPGATAIRGDALLELDVDLLLPSALENVITSENAERIQARVIAERANGPTTPDADAILFNQGKFVIPDILCNAGGVIVSYFEWLQNRAGEGWTQEEVHERLERKINEAFHQVLETSLNHEDMRTAAYLVAVQRVMSAMTARGWC